MTAPDRERWRRIEALFAEIVDLPPAERARLLASRTDDPALLREVERLLAAHDRADGFLDGLDTTRAAALVRDSAEQAGTIGPYRVLGRLGRGGMGVVYLAEDPRLDRRVALKLLPAGRSADETAQRRFTDEAKAASALDHPHIATIYEIGETPDHELYIAMAYYPGETLRERLERGPLPVDEAVDLAAQIAAGLAAAHARGIVHRDIKPANVILTPPTPPATAATARIVDFGVAKMAGTALTRTGAAIGTVAYMSPEQTGAGVVDARTDLWSLGVTLFEMLAGVRPFRADSEQALIYAIRHDEPPPLRTLRPDVPESVARIVQRCLARDPAGRFADAQELLAELAALRASPHASPKRRRAAAARYAAVAALAILPVAALSVWPRDRSTSAAPDAQAEPAALARSRIAVLPLANYSPDPADDYFADGLTEELVSRLSRLGALRVIARTSVMPYRTGGKSIAEIGRELQVGAVLEGSVRKDGDRVRITVQLVDAQTQEHLWSHDYDAVLTDVLAVQSAIATEVAEALNLEVQQEERRRLMKRETADPEAYRLYLQGRHFWHRRDAGNFRRALSLFRQAIDRDPLYAPAWAGMADTYEMLAEDELPAEQGVSLARAAAERALELDPDLAEAHTALATILVGYDLDWERAERHFRRALAANPSYALAWQRYSALLAATGRLDDAVVAAERAQALDPLSLYARAALGYSLYLARRPDEALAQLEATRELDPDFGLTHLNLVLLHLGMRRYDRALEAARTLHALWGDSPTALGLVGHAWAAAGEPQEAQRVLGRMDAMAAERPVSAFHFAVLHLGLGDHDRAIEQLEAALEQKSTALLVYLDVDPIFDPLRGSPRFRSLLERVGLED